MILYKKILSEKARLKKAIQEAQDKLCTLPEGAFFCTEQQNHTKWYKRESGRQIYIPKGNRELAEKLLIEKPRYAELISPQLRPLSYTLHQWATASYPQNTKYPEKKIHQVRNDLFVRSKSEAMIASQLLAYEIPFRYECALHRI